jgi:hypothetical protein
VLATKPPLPNAGDPPMRSDRAILLAEATPHITLGTYTIERHGRFWKVVDAVGDLVCLTVYKRGAREVVRRLTGIAPGVSTAPATTINGL